jgi:hypothetical protein
MLACANSCLGLFSLMVGYLWAWLHLRCMQHWTCMPLFCACCCSSAPFVDCACGLWAVRTAAAQGAASRNDPADCEGTSWLLLLCCSSARNGVFVLSSL